MRNVLAESVHADPAFAGRPAVRPHALDGYALPTMSAGIERLLVLAFVAFLIVQTVEAPLRYLLTSLGAPWLIYARDGGILLALAALALQQLWHHRLQTAFVVFGLIALFHGTIGLLQCPSPLAAMMSLRMLLNPLFGAVLLPILLRGKRGFGLLFTLLWLVTAAGLAADFARWHLPWKGMTSTVGDYTVVVNKRWDYEGEDRLGGFARDSVSAAMLLAFLGTYALLFARSFAFRAVAAIGTLALIYLTTTKGCVVAYALVVVACTLPTKRSQFANKLILTVAFALMLLLPVALPQFSMPSSPTVLASFFDRIVRVWPAAWHSIGSHSWVFGAGMGNIGAGEQYLKFEVDDPADNLFLLAYGFFGVFSIVYLTWPFLASLRLRAPVDVVGRYAIVTLIYAFSYGIVVNIIEGPVAAFMLGSALQALALRKAVPEPDVATAAPLPMIASGA